MRGSRLVTERGDKFNMLEFIEKRKSIKDGAVTKSVGLFRCDCGNEKEYRILDVRTGHTKSCGCIRKECNIKHGQTIGKKLSKEYVAWSNMKERCTNPNTRHFHSYGGRGIEVCERWLTSFDNFFEDMGKSPFKNYTLDRINVNGNYCVDNCRWASMKEQANNTRKNINIEYNFETLSAKGWSEKTGIPASTIIGRYHRGLPTELLFYKGNIPKNIIENYKNENNNV